MDNLPEVLAAVDMHNSDCFSAKLFFFQGACLIIDGHICAYYLSVLDLPYGLLIFAAQLLTKDTSREQVNTETEIRVRKIIRCGIGYHPVGGVIGQLFSAEIACFLSNSKKRIKLVVKIACPCAG